MKLKDFERLPDCLPTEEIASLFSFVIKDFEQKKIDKREFLSIICELTDRQTRTYELLPSSLRNEVDIVLCEIWNTDSLNDVDDITFIVINLGLKLCFEKAKESLAKNNLNLEIKSEIEGMIKEVGENILNPYLNLERFK